MAPEQGFFASQIRGVTQSWSLGWHRELLPAPPAQSRTFLPLAEPCVRLEVSLAWQ